MIVDGNGVESVGTFINGAANGYTAYTNPQAGGAGVIVVDSTGQQ